MTVRFTSGEGAPVLVIHSWWGLTDSFRDYAAQLGSHGFFVGCADLFEGETATTEAEAQVLRKRRRSTPAYRRLMTMLDTVVAHPHSTGDPPAVIGFSMGGHWSAWLAQQAEVELHASVLYYAARGGSYPEQGCPVLAHFAEHDEFVSDGSRTRMRRALSSRGLLEYDYPGARHWFSESSHPNFDPDASALALERTVAFLTS